MSLRWLWRLLTEIAPTLNGPPSADPLCKSASSHGPTTIPTRSEASSLARRNYVEAPAEAARHFLPRAADSSIRQCATAGVGPAEKPIASAVLTEGAWQPDSGSLQGGHSPVGMQVPPNSLAFSAYAQQQLHCGRPDNMLEPELSGFSLQFSSQCFSPSRSNSATVQPVCTDEQGRESLLNSPRPRSGLPLPSHHSLLRQLTSASSLSSGQNKVHPAGATAASAAQVSPCTSPFVRHH